MRFCLLPSLAACVLMACLPALAGTEFVTITPDQLEWQDVPDHEGLKVAFLVGRPDKPGLYAMRVRFSAGVMSRPHSHNRDRQVTVIEGTRYASCSIPQEPCITMVPRTSP